MSKLNLTNLRKGDVLVCRDGTRREFDHYSKCGNVIFTKSKKSPMNWRSDGSPWNGLTDGPWDIVRVIRRRPAAKKRDDKDAVWVMRYVKYLRENDYDTGAELSRLRRIAKRLNGGRKVGA